MTWLDNDAEAFADVIGRLGFNMGQVEAVCAYKKRPHPRNMTLDQRLKLIAWLGTPDGDAAVALATKGKE
jgi:hypothetical protein